MTNLLEYELNMYHHRNQRYGLMQYDVLIWYTNWCRIIIGFHVVKIVFKFNTVLLWVAFWDARDEQIEVDESMEVRVTLRRHTPLRVFFVSPILSMFIREFVPNLSILI